MRRQDCGNVMCMWFTSLQVHLYCLLSPYESCFPRSFQKPDHYQVTRIGRKLNHLSRIFIIYIICLQVEMYIDDEPSSPCRGRCCPLSPPSMLHLGIPHPLPATLPRPSLPFLLYSRDTYLLYLHLLFPCLISSHTTFKHENFKTDAISHYCTLQTISLVAEGGFIALLMECGHFLPVHLWHLLACAPLASL